MTYSTRIFDPNIDRESLLSLWFSILKKPTLDRFRYMYEENPCGEIVTMLLYRDDTRTPVGALSVLSRVLNGVRVGVNFDMIVAKEHRTLGPAVILLKSLMTEFGRRGHEGLLAMPNAMSRPIFKRAGYRSVGQARRWGKVLRSEGKIPATIGNRWLRTCACVLVDFTLKVLSFEWIYSVIYAKKMRRHAEGSDWPESLRSPAETAKDQTAEYMRWRYRDVPGNQAQVYTLSNASGVNGVIVYSVEESDVLIEDLYVNNLALPVAALLCGFMNLMRLQGMHSISTMYLGDPRFERVLRQLGFFKRQVREVYLFSENEALQRTFSHNTGLFLHNGDLDL